MCSQGENSTQYRKNITGDNRATIFVDVINGSDKNEGQGRHRPVKTFARVCEIARKYKSSIIYLMQSDISSINLELANIPGTVELTLLDSTGVAYVSVGSVYIRGCNDVRILPRVRVTKTKNLSLSKTSDTCCAIALENAKVKTGQQFQVPLYVTPTEASVNTYYAVYSDGSTFAPYEIGFYDTVDGGGQKACESLACFNRLASNLTLPINVNTKLPHVPKPYTLVNTNDYANHQINIADINAENYVDYNTPFVKSNVELTYNKHFNAITERHGELKDTSTFKVYLNGNVKRYEIDLKFNDTGRTQIASGTALCRLPQIARPRLSQKITGVGYAKDSSLNNAITGQYGVTLEINPTSGYINTYGVLPATVTEIVIDAVLM